MTTAIQEKVKAELTEMKKVGMRVPKKAFSMIENMSEAELAEYSSMTVSELSDLIIALC